MSMDVEETKGRKVEHYVDPTPFNPAVTEEMTAEQERFYQASQWQIMWWKFKRHKLAVWSGVILILFYLCVPFAEVIAPYTANSRDSLHLFAPPQSVHFIHDGSFVGPFVYGMTSEIDMTNQKHQQHFQSNSLYQNSFFLLTPLLSRMTSKIGHRMHRQMIQYLSPCSSPH